ncbi:MAG: tetratricopeptide repeat protein [Nostoc sp. DedQUE08]|uniref:tetratricopeptide repeat protein n=1 Tax=Nostoc sp. DedQUE08 TaxID=3075393 RepID=UPI002AD4A661|nr:tetratricopeptide repeat protein [Nostoc sp. DedQUE08]MDZ8070728.1 tetratricopeptide repeat protein [Nostoc sp. DedQUE08]
MPEDSGKFAEKIGAFASPNSQVNIGTQIIEGQKQLTPIKSIPYRGSVHFVGRETELIILHEDLQRKNYVAIAGMGGVGKTELATQYARRYQQDYGGIAWFNDRETNLAAEVLEFFRLQFGLEIPQELGGRLLSLKQQIAWCWSKYPNSELPILIVFDDVTDLDNLRQVVPNDNRFYVLITTRLRNLDPNFIQEIPLDVLSPQKEPGKALELLKRLLGEKDKRVENQLQAATAILCECLEYLPLGIELVGAYLVRDPDISLDIMFRRLQERKLAEAAIQDRKTLNSTQLGVKAAFALTWEELDPLAQQLGIFLSLFSPVQILWDLVLWVAGGGETENQEQTKLTWSEEELNAAKKELYKRNLLQLVEDGEGYYKIHALVRWFLQEQFGEAGEMKSVLETTFATAMIAVAQILPDSAPSEHIESIRDIVPHLEDLGKRIIAEMKEAKEAQIISLASVPNDKVASIFAGVGRFYQGQGLYKLAEPWHKDCVNVCQVLFAGDHPDVATSLNELAGLYHNQGRYSDAEPLNINALAMRKRLFDGDHLDVATSSISLAFLYYSQGRYNDAEPFYIDALAMTKRLFAGDHRNVATTLNGLALLYKSQGRYSDAEPFYIDALAMRKRLFAGDHFDVASSLNDLAVLYHSQARYSEAEPLYIDALTMTKRLFAGDYPSEATNLSNLAELYRIQGRYSEAESLLIDALEMTKRLFAGDHPNVAANLNNLAFLYYSQGRYSNAEPLYIDALEMTRRLFNGDHPDVATNLNNLATLYNSQRQYSDAERLLNDALAMRKRLFAGDHPDVATNLNDLAGFYCEQRRYSDAEPLLIDSLAMTKRLFAGDHPNVAISLNNLAAFYYGQRRYRDAEPLLNDSLAMTKRLFAGDHPNVASSLNNLAELYRSQRQYSKAEPLYIDALAMRKRLFVDDHSDVAISLNNLGLLYIGQGRFSDAELLLSDALAMCDRIFGVNHHTTVKVRLNLTILQWIHRLGQVIKILLRIFILPFSLLWRLAKKLIRN